MEFENGVGRNETRHTLIPVTEMRPDPDAALAADTHPLNPVFEPGYHLPLAEAERTRLILLYPFAVVQEQVISRLNNTPALGARAIPDLSVFVLDATASLRHL